MQSQSKDVYTVATTNPTRAEAFAMLGRYMDGAIQPGTRLLVDMVEYMYTRNKKQLLEYIKEYTCFSGEMSEEFLGFLKMLDEIRTDKKPKVSVAAARDRSSFGNSWWVYRNRYEDRYPGVFWNVVYRGMAEDPPVEFMGKPIRNTEDLLRQVHLTGKVPRIRNFGKILGGYLIDFANFIFENPEERLLE